MYRAKSVDALLLAIAALLSLLISSCGKADFGDDIIEVSGTLDLTNDSLHVQIGDASGVYAYSDFKMPDTINSEVPLDFTFYTSRDTLVIPSDTATQYLLLTAGDSFKIVAITYFRLARQNFSERIDLLRKYDSFSTDEPTVAFDFTYFTDDPGLLELNEKYNLDSIAGPDDELTRIINLLYWVNMTVRQDGSVDPADPDPKNALNIMATAERENKGVNCRMMATVLNDVYLATGFKSRHITCLPYDKEDPDCHVINIVYSESLGKWLYVDPTFAGYFMDTSGYLLSVEEVRQRLIDGERLFLPDDLNWNGEPYNKVTYTNYMAKNLFRFFCPMSSEFGYESKAERAWVHLNPIGYDDERLNTADTTKTGDNTFVDYYIGNAEAFWAAP